MAQLISLLLAPPVTSLGGNTVEQFVDLAKRAAMVYTVPPAPLSLWTEFFKNVRIWSRMGQTIPLPSLSEIMDGIQPLAMYYLPMIILMGVLILAAIILTIASCGMCCSMCCCKKRLRRKYEEKKQPGPFKRITAWILFFMPAIVIGLSITAHIGGSNYLTTGLTTIATAVLGLVDHSSALLSAVSPTLVTVVDNLKVSVNESIDMAVEAVNMNEIDTKVFPSLTTMIDGLKSVQTQVESIKLNQLTVESQTTNLQSSANTLLNSNLKLIYDAVDINNEITDLSSTDHPITGAPGTTWKLTIPVSFTPIDASQLASKANAAPDTASIFSSLNTAPNLTTIALDAEEAMNAAKNTALTTIVDTKSNLKGSIMPILEDSKSSIVSNLAPQEADINDKLASTKEDINAFWEKIQSYDNLSYNLICVPYYLLLYLLAIVFLLVTVILGDVCYYAFDVTPSPLSSLASIYGDAISVVDSCYNGTTLLTAAEPILPINVSAYNLNALAGNQIDSFDFSGVSDFDLSAAVDLGTDPASEVTSITSIDLSSMDTKPVQDINDTLVPSLRNDFLSLKTVLQNLSAMSTKASLTLNGPSRGDSATQDAAFAAFQLQISSIISQIDDIIRISPAGDLSNMGESAVGLVSAIKSINSSATIVIGLAAALPADYTIATTSLLTFGNDAKNNITLKIPQIKNKIKSDIADQQSFIDSSFSCQNLANDVYTIRDGLCGQTMSSLDAFWSSLTIMSLWSLFSLPVTVYVANSLFLDLSRYQKKAEELETKDEDIFTPTKHEFDAPNIKKDTRGAKVVSTLPYSPDNSPAHDLIDSGDGEGPPIVQFAKSEDDEEDDASESEEEESSEESEEEAEEGEEGEDEYEGEDEDEDDEGNENGEEEEYEEEEDQEEEEEDQESENSDSSEEAPSNQHQEIRSGVKRMDSGEIIDSKAIPVISLASSLPPAPANTILPTSKSSVVQPPLTTESSISRQSLGPKSVTRAETISKPPLATESSISRQSLGPKSVTLAETTKSPLATETSISRQSLGPKSVTRAETISKPPLATETSISRQSLGPKSVTETTKSTLATETSISRQSLGPKSVTRAETISKPPLATESSISRQSLGPKSTENNSTRFSAMHKELLGRTDTISNSSRDQLNVDQSSNIKPLQSKTTISRKVQIPPPPPTKIGENDSRSQSLSQTMFNPGPESDSARKGEIALEIKTQEEEELSRKMSWLQNKDLVNTAKPIFTE